MSVEENSGAAQIARPLVKPNALRIKNPGAKRSTAHALHAKKNSDHMTAQSIAERYVRMTYSSNLLFYAQRWIADLAGID